MVFYQDGLDGDPSSKLTTLNPNFAALVIELMVEAGIKNPENRKKKPRVAIAFSGSNGNFELNTYRPLIAFNIHESISLLSEASESFVLNALDGLSANKDKIAENLGKSLMLVTALVPEIGYEKSAEIAKKALKENISLKESAKKLKYLSEKEFDKIVKPKSMVSPKKV